MSQTDTPRKTILPVRWVVLFTGSKATEDYEPAASTGEPDDLVKEVSRLCVDFHPHAEIRLFPQDNDVLLFWRATSTADFVVTRVTIAPNPRGLRTALEYCSLVFSEPEFARLGFDPFRARDLKLHDLVREQFLGGRKAPLEFALPAAGGVRGMPTVSGSAPALGAEAPATAENIRALQERSARESEAGHVPPTFATWWASGTQPPAGYFEIVLRSVPLRVMTLREATDQAATLAAETKSSLPNAPSGDALALDLSRSILASADALQSAVAGVAARLHTDTPEQFREGLTDAAGQATRVASDLTSFGKRLGAELSEENAEALTDLANRYEALGQEMPKIRHPNPFGNRAAPVTNAAMTSASASRNTAATKQPGSGGSGGTGSKYMIGGAVLAGIALLAVWKGFSGGGSSGSATKVQPGAMPITPAPSVSTPAATPAVDPGVATLLQEQDAVAPSAKKRAHEAAKLAAAKSPLSEVTVEKITAGAINQAYKQKLSPEQYQTAFKTPWDYAHFKQALVTLTPSVHEAAMVGATEGKAAAQTRQSEAAAATPEPTPKIKSTPAPETKIAKRSERTSDTKNSDNNDRKSRRNSDNEHTTSSSKPPREKKAATSPPPTAHKAANPPAAPRTGSAAQTGL